MKLKDMFTLHTVRKKLLMVSKIMGILLILSYLASAYLPLKTDTAFFLWMLFVVAMVLLLDFLLGRLISRPVAKLGRTARAMAKLDFSTPCDLRSRDEFGELSDNLNTMGKNLQQALADLKEMNARLEADVEKERKLLEERKELTDRLSHEMKTPLGVIRAYAEGLIDSSDEKTRQKYAEVIAAETERMNGLITSLLELSALESGAVQLSPKTFDFVELLEREAGRLLMDVPGGDFSLEYELPEQPVYVSADRRLMEQAVDNLLVNAGKNVVPGGRIRLSLTECCLPNGTPSLHFSVCSESTSIPEERLPKLWQKFYRDPDVGYAGSGLGLAAASQIFTMHGLPYGVRNTNAGVDFSFDIPIAEPADTPGNRR